MTNLAEVSVETMVRKRRAILLAALVYGGLWQITRIVDDLTQSGRLLRGPWMAVLLLVQLVGYVGWTTSLVWLVTYTKRLKQNPALAEALGDEFYQQVRLKAFALACGGAGLCQGTLLAVSVFHPLTAQVGADMTIFVICTTAFAAFLWMERSE